jgi:hypothetical protein
MCASGLGADLCEPRDAWRTLRQVVSGAKKLLTTKFAKRLRKALSIF